jgi:DNA invertase Pin-like site-specific DNA recombinase
MPAYIAYLRVSTQKQGESGLGLDAQNAAIARHVGGQTVVATFTEVESGKRNDRPQLTAAIAEAKRSGATLVIAKLDRLARNVHFVSGLMESGVEFVACDMPHANRLTLHIMAAIAEHEAEMISKRTVAALVAARERGTKLGGYRGKGALSAASKLKGRIAQANAADHHAARMKPIIADLRGKGRNSYASVAKALTDLGYTAPRGGSWSSAQVKRAELRG